MDRTMRQRYEEVEMHDLVAYFADKNIIPHCVQCDVTDFNYPVVQITSIGPAGDARNSSGVKLSIEPFEMHGSFSTWAFYPLSCRNCGTFLNVDALRVLLWTEQQRLNATNDVAKTAGDNAELGHE